MRDIFSLYISKYFWITIMSFKRFSSEILIVDPPTDFALSVKGSYCLNNDKQFPYSKSFEESCDRKLVSYYKRIHVLHKFFFFEPWIIQSTLTKVLRVPLHTFWRLFATRISIRRVSSLGASLESLKDSGATQAGHISRRNIRPPIARGQNSGNFLPTMFLTWTHISRIGLQYWSAEEKCYFYVGM